MNPGVSLLGICQTTNQLPGVISEYLWCAYVGVVVGDR